MMNRRRMLLINGRIEEISASGNPLVFNTNIVDNLVSYNIVITPIQNGTGEASPENIRAISGKNGIIITHQNDNYVRNFLSTVYDASYNVITGELIPLTALFTWDISNVSQWVQNGDTGYFQCRRPSNFNQTTIGAWGTGLYKSNFLGNPVRSTNSTNGVRNNGYYAGSTYITARCDSLNQDITTWQNFINTNTLQILALLTESARTPIYLTPIEIETIFGINTITNNINDNNNIIYLRRN